MKSILLSTFFLFCVAGASSAQVTQINSNKSLQPITPLTSDMTILVSATDSTLWATNGTLAGTIPLSPTILYRGTEAILNGKLIFKGFTPATGIEIFVTDGTPGGTTLISDIYPGTTGSIPDDEMAVLNGFVYFTASRPAEGRELWRTNGTLGGTSLVKDMVSGPADSNLPDSFNLFSNGTYLLLAVRTAALGAELWKSNGSGAGTIPLKDINPNAPSSSPAAFYRFGDLVFFQATDSRGRELWKTDGTEANTTILKDINPGPGSSISSGFGGFDVGFSSFYQFNGKAYFTANDGTRGSEVWFTNGTEAGTDILKDIQAGPFAITVIANAVTVANKFFFASTDGATRFEMWASDGTPDGTQLFKAFTPASPLGVPFIYPSFEIDINTENVTQPLFQGNKFFFTAGTVDEGVELWVSDGTLLGTKMVKNIGPGDADGVMFGAGAYTQSYFYFTANDETHGTELWRSDATDAGTTYVADINLNAEDADPVAWPIINNGKLLFTATNGDNANETDLYVVDGVSPLPLSLLDFTVTANSNDALLKWSTTQEVNSKDFIIQRSFNGTSFTDVSGVSAAGTSSIKRNYNFTDVGITSSGKSVVYYRLNSRDKDGKTTLSKVISLNLKKSNKWNVQIVTNPVRNNLNLMITGVQENVQFTITDMSGKALYKSIPSKANGQVTIPTIILQAGVYVLVSESNNERKTVMFVK
jgi:ELWxxDGT repeat protein